MAVSVIELFIMILPILFLELHISSSARKIESTVNNTKKIFKIDRFCKLIIIFPCNKQSKIEKTGNK